MTRNEDVPIVSKRQAIEKEELTTKMEQQQHHHHHQLSKKRILNQLQSEVRALKETFLRAADIVEQMGHAMDTLDSVENDHLSNDSFLWENSSGRTRRNTHYQPKMNSNSEEAYLVRTLAEKMKTLPMQKVREIRSVAEEMKI